MDNILIVNTEAGLEFLCEEIGDAEGFDSPTIRDVFIDPPEAEGSLLISELAGKRELAFKALLKDDIAVNRRLLARVCKPGGLKTLKLTTCDGLELQIDATVKLANPYSEVRSTYLISAKAPFPYFQSQELKSLSTAVTVRKGGMPIPAAIPGPIGAGGGAPFVVNNLGDTTAKPIFEIQGPGSNFLVQNLDTGELFRLQTSIAAGETVIIDTNTNEATKGNQNVFGLITRSPVNSWVSLKSGQNRIVFSAISGTNEATKLTIKWRDTYAGI